jgi:hypothetical protein
MKQNFTPEDLMAYLYAETSLSLRLAVQDALRRDPVLAQELEQLRMSKRQFPKVKFTAPKRSLQRIMNYSRSTALEGQI